MQATVARKSNFSILSNVPGRQRWRVPSIDSKPRLAAALEVALRKQPAILLVKANPLTGSVLVKWLPSQPAPAIEVLILAALESGPVSPAVYRKLRPEPDGKVRKLINKLILGGVKLTLVLFSRMV